MRILTMVEACRRVRALDDHYLNADRWLRRAREAGDPTERAAADRAYVEADREYRRLRDTPYSIIAVR